LVEHCAQGHDTVTRILRPFLILLAMLAIVGQPAAYAALAITPAHTSDVGSACAGMVEMPAATKATPCHGLTLECLAQLGCMQASALPSQPNRPAKPVAWRSVHYPHGRMVVIGLTVEPEVFPPIA